MKKVIPDFSIQNCQEALNYYQEVFGGEIKNLQMTDDKEMFKVHEGKVLHAELHINSECVLYFNDVFEPKTIGNNINTILALESLDEINDIYNKLKEKGKVTFELQKTFWGSYHAVVIDYNGFIWSLDYAEE